ASGGAGGGAGAARNRGARVRPLREGGLVQGGQGARQRRYWAARTDRTGALAESVAGRAGLTHDLLRAAGVPVAEGNAGPTCRLLVVGDRVVAAARSQPGDGPGDVRHEDVTDLVHPEVAARAVDAARVVGLDV